jgi:hypothetical protein
MDQKINIHSDLRFQMMDLNLVERILPMMNFSFIIFGTLGNILTFFLLIQKNVRKHSSMRYLAALSLVDTLCLYTWNFSIVYQFFTNKKIEHVNEICCRLFSFFSYSILQSSSWIICAIGFDRLLTFIFKKDNALTRLIHNTKFLIAINVVVIFMFNFIVVVINAEPNRTKIVYDPLNSSNFSIIEPKWSYNCYQPEEFYFIWDIVHIIMYSILPFFIILIENALLALFTMQHARQMRRSFLSSNKTLTSILSHTAVNTSSTMNFENINSQRSLLSRCCLNIAAIFDKRKRMYRKAVNIRENDPLDGQNQQANTSSSFAKSFTEVLIVQAKRNKRQQTKGSQVANLLLFLTFSFIVCTVPYSTFYALKVNIQLLDMYGRNVVINILSLLQYTRHAGNFLIYLSTSSILKNEIKCIIIDLRLKFRNKFRS